MGEGACEGEGHVAAMKTARIQIDRGRLFMFEHLVGAQSWNDRAVMQIARHEGVRIVRLDQGMVGLKDRETGGNPT